MLAVMLCDDLIFTSRVRATAAAAGGELLTARNAEQLLALVRERPPRCVILDLQNETLIIDDLMRTLRPLVPVVVGYGSHVDAETLRAARAAGCDAVMPRSQFVERLETSMRTWLGVSS